MYMTKNICEKGMSFNDCELAILRSAVDKAEELQAKKDVNTPEVKKMISIVEKFLTKKGLICYGGTAINNILPEMTQFYDKELDLPDYDFFSVRGIYFPVYSVTGYLLSETGIFFLIFFSTQSFPILVLT